MRNASIVKQVSRKNGKASDILAKLTAALAVLFLLEGIALSRAFMLPCFMTAALYIVYDILRHRDYEYVLEGRKLTITTIYAKQYRRKAQEINLDDMTVTAPNRHPSVAKYLRKGGEIRLPKYDYTSYDDDIPYYTMIAKGNGKDIKLLLDLDDEMLNILYSIYPNKVFLE